MTPQGRFLYISRSSFVEAWDPRAKLAVAGLLGVGMLVAGSLAGKAALLAAALALWAMARLPWRMLAATFVPLTLLFVSTMAYHTLLGSAAGGGSAFAFRSEGVASGLAMCAQIAGLVLALALPVRTTPPLVLAEALELLLAPLKRFKLPVHEAALIFSITLRFLPTLFAEFAQIREAQIARGGGFHRGGLLQRARGVLPLLLPLFVRSIVRAEELAAAMDSRCYGGGEGRTRLREYRWTSRDSVVTAAAIALFALACADRWLR